MNTPICDFVRGYAESDWSRLHMPGHKGRAFLGCEDMDITEIAGADELFDAEGIIAQSEANAARLFGVRATLYSTEGSSLCIRAMLCLALKRAPRTGRRPVILAARNAHKSFLYACALLDFDVEWIYPADDGALSICSCPATPEQVRRALDEMPIPPAAVYLTSPDYLGQLTDIAGVSAVCRAVGVPLLVDNAHGAYLRFLAPSRHPMDLGAYLCCDSAHKTLPALTGGAYLHLSEEAFREVGHEAASAMTLFGSTSPSYLILQSLDLCNRYLSDGYPDRLKALIGQIDGLKAELAAKGVPVLPSEPLKLVVHAAAIGCTGYAAADALRQEHAEPEFADGDCLVLMFTPENRPADFERLRRALLSLPHGKQTDTQRPALFARRPERRMSIREAVLAPHQRVNVEQSLGRVCGEPSVSCPPAVPIAVSGEVITEEMCRVFESYGIEQIRVVTSV